MATGTLQDMWRDVLVSKGYSGVAQDMERQYWAAKASIPLVGTLNDVKYAALQKLLTPAGNPYIAWIQKQSTTGAQSMSLTTPIDTLVADQIFAALSLPNSPGTNPSPFVTIASNALGNGQQNFYRATGLTPSTTYTWGSTGAQLAAMFICVRNALANPVYTNTPKPATVSTSHPTGAYTNAGESFYVSLVADRVTPFVSSTYVAPATFTKLDSSLSGNGTDGTAAATLLSSGNLVADNWTLCQNTQYAATCLGAYKSAGAGGNLVPGTLDDLEWRYWNNLLAAPVSTTINVSKFLCLQQGKVT